MTVVVDAVKFIILWFCDKILKLDKNRLLFCRKNFDDFYRNVIAVSIMTLHKLLVNCAVFIAVFAK